MTINPIPVPVIFAPIFVEGSVEISWRRYFDFERSIVCKDSRLRFLPFLADMFGSGMSIRIQFGDKPPNDAIVVLVCVVGSMGSWMTEFPPYAFAND